MKYCSFPMCLKPMRNNGLCVGHNRQAKLGQRLRPLRRKRPKNSEPRIEWDERECPNPELGSPCFIYRGAKSNGYGNVGIGKRSARVHRYVWELVYGPIPEGMEIDHRCRVRACCNLFHLRLVTHRINGIENSASFCADNIRKTHCPQGHPYSEGNTYRRANGHRVCRTCVLERMRHPAVMVKHRCRKCHREIGDKAGKAFPNFNRHLKSCC